MPKRKSKLNLTCESSPTTITTSLPSPLKEDKDIVVNTHLDTSLQLKNPSKKRKTLQENSISSTISNNKLTKTKQPLNNHTPVKNKHEKRTLPHSIASISNKLSESNLDAMLNELDLLLKAYPKQDTINTLITQFLKSLTQQSFLIDSFVLVHSGFIMCASAIFGMDILACFVHHIVRRWHELLNLNDVNFKKEQGYLLVFLAFIYNFDGISNELIFDIINTIEKNFSESQFDFLLRMIRLVGLKLYKSNPEKFKSTMVLLCTTASTSFTSTTSLRSKFGLEAFQEIAQAKFRHQSFYQVNEIPFFTLCFQLLKKRGLPRWQPLEQHSLDNVLNNTSVQQQPCPAPTATQLGAELFKLAKKHHMNSDLKRTIFAILMTSEDYMDAYERLLKLGLKEKQERDIVRVIVQCAGQEKKFNPYYAHLSQKLCTWKHGFKITFQYTLWDFLKTDQPKKRVAVAHLFGYFVAHKILSLLAILKGIDRRQSFHLDFLHHFVQRIELELGREKAAAIEGVNEVKELLRQTFSPSN